MRNVVAYHPEIGVVRHDGSIVIVEVDLDDWYSDEEVIALVGARVASGEGLLRAAAAGGWCRVVDRGSARIVWGEDDRWGSLM